MHRKTIIWNNVQKNSTLVNKYVVWTKQELKNLNFDLNVASQYINVIYLYSMFFSSKWVNTIREASVRKKCDYGDLTPIHFAAINPVFFNQGSRV